MCQCLICGCWWYNYCGVCCGGCHEANLIYSWWLCKPEDLRMLDPQCCHICACDGLGGNCLYAGSICCAPKAVQEWSGLRSAGKTASDLNSGKTIIINNTSPNVYMQQPEMGYQVTTTTRSNSGMNANVNMGGMGMNANVNMNGMGGGVHMNNNMNGVHMNTNMNGMGGGVQMNANMNGGVGVNMNTNMGGMGGGVQVNTNMNGMHMGGNVGMGGGVYGNNSVGLGVNTHGNVGMGVGVGMGGGVSMNTNVNMGGPSANAKISF